MRKREMQISIIFMTVVNAEELSASEASKRLHELNRKVVMSRQETRRSAFRMLIASALLVITPLCVGATVQDMQRDMQQRREQQQREDQARSEERARQDMEGMRKMQENNREQMQRLEEMNRKQTQEREKFFRESEEKARREQAEERATRQNEAREPVPTPQ